MDTAVTAAVNTATEGRRSAENAVLLSPQPGHVLALQQTGGHVTHEGEMVGPNGRTETSQNGPGKSGTMVPGSCWDRCHDDMTFPSPRLDQPGSSS